MRTKTIILALLLMIPLAGCVPDASSGSERNGGIPVWGQSVITNDTIDISFEKKEYSGWNLSGTIVINVTLTNRGNASENLTIVTGAQNSYQRSPRGISLYTYNKNILLAPFESKALELNLTIRHDQNAAFRVGFYATVYRAGRIPSQRFCSNYTTVTSYGDCSVKVVAPVPSMGTLRFQSRKPIQLTMNITNYSDETVNGRLELQSSSIKVLLGPRSTTSATIRINDTSQTENLMHVSLISPQITSELGFDLEGEVAANVTEPVFKTIGMRYIGINIVPATLELGVAGRINISVSYGSEKPLSAARFDVRIGGWLNEGISHPGYFTIPRMEPWSTTNISYNITPHVSGSFVVLVSTKLRGEYFNSDVTIYIKSKAGPVIPSPRFSDFSNVEGDKVPVGRSFAIEGYFSNGYPYALRGVKLNVVLRDKVSGFLSTGDFLTVQPEEIDLGTVESCATVPFAFNITLNSNGLWEFGVIASWGGNVTTGGNDKLLFVYTGKADLQISLPLIIALSAAFAATPKVADIIIRRKRGIHS